MKISWLVPILSLGLAAAACGELDLGGPGDGQSVQFSAGYAFLRDGEIYVADRADYQSAKRLTESGSNSHPAISADGRVIVFVHADAQGVTSLRKVSPAGGDESEILVGTADRQLGEPALSPDGNLVAFVAREAGASSIGLVGIDGLDERMVPGSSNDSSPSFYPDGASVLVLSGSDPLSRDQLINVELSAGVRTVQGAGIGTFGSRAAVSPDGRQIAFEMRSEGRSRIFVLDDSGMPRQISNTGGNDTSPTWVGNARVGFSSDAGSAANVYEIEVGVGLEGSAYLTVPSASQCSYGGSV